jgi:hypothetical protein
MFISYSIGRYIGFLSGAEKTWMVVSVCFKAKSISVDYDEDADTMELIITDAKGVKHLASNAWRK